MAGTRPGLQVVTQHDVDVPMRDGTLLRTNIFRPASGGPWPALVSRTPYGKGDTCLYRLVRAGYVVVRQDTRGRYASEGTWVPFTVEDTGDAEDGYDMIEWTASQPWCNGRVGTFGASYCGWMQWQAAARRPPHLQAMCATTIPTELHEVDYTGSFRPGRRIKWWLSSMAPDVRRRAGLPGQADRVRAREVFETLEGADWLHFLPWKDLPAYLPEGLAEYAAAWLNNPTCTPWRFRELHHEVEVPNLDFSGWFDHCNGTIGHLAGMQHNARTECARTQTRLVLGPWNHPGMGRRQCGEVDFGQAAEVDLSGLMLAWFDHWLKDLDTGITSWPTVQYFEMGSGAWKQADTWPPPAAGSTTLYLDGPGQQREGRLAMEAPQRQDADRYRYDPRTPVPTLWTEDLFTVPADRSRLDHRRDILTYRTEPLTDPVALAGRGEVVLHVSTSAPDTDFFAYLADEHPDGRALDVCYGMVRLRHRNGLECNDPVTPGEPLEIVIRLGDSACRFMPGHRLRLDITSSDFPNHDRNHNTGGDDLGETTLAVADQTVLHGGVTPSRVVLPFA